MLQVFLVFLKACTLSFPWIENSLTDSKTAGCYFQKLVIVDKLNSLLKAFQVFLVFLKACTLSFPWIENSLTDSKTAGCYFQKLVIVDKLNSLLKA